MKIWTILSRRSRQTFMCAYVPAPTTMYTHGHWSLLEENKAPDAVSLSKLRPHYTHACRERCQGKKIYSPSNKNKLFL